MKQPLQIQKLLRSLPSVDKLLAENATHPFADTLDHESQAECARAALARLREEIADGRFSAAATEVPACAKSMFLEEVQRLVQRSLRRVINCSGIILHTGLGRSVYPDAAIENVQEILRGYSNLEFDLERGERGDRTAHVESLLCRLTGAEAACVVNNNAAAVLIALNTLANRKQVIISRGELIEIGGSFRMPAVIAKSGARMVEVGTTNKTHLQDFAEAITPRTAALLHVHTSNYRIQGFTQSVSLPELIALAKEHGLRVVHDLGGGILVDLRKFGLPYEPVVNASVRAGVDVATFSGDKVIGGPQCGILVGKQALIAKIKKNPLMRVLRCDKLTFALLESTLRLFLNPGRLAVEHQVLRMLSEPIEAVRSRADSILKKLGPVPGGYKVEICDSTAQAGSGTLPLEKIPSVAIRFQGKPRQVHELARRLRTGQPAIIGYLRKQRFYLDIRTVLPNEIDPLIAGVRAALTK